MEEANCPRQETPTSTRWRFAWALFWALVFVDALGNFSTTAISSGERTARILSQIEKALPRHVGLFIAGALALAILDRILRGENGEPARERLQNWQSDRLVLRVCLASILVTLAFVLSTLLKGFLPNSVAALAESLCLLTGVLILFDRPLSTGPRGWNDLGLRSGPWAKWVLLGFFAAVILNLAEPLLGDLLYPWFIYRSTPNQVLIRSESTWLMAVIVLIRAVVVAPVVQELVFRGAILTALDSKIRSSFWAVVVGALCFADMIGVSLPAWPGVIALALLSSLLLYRTRSLIPSIALLAATNLYWWIHTVRPYVP